MHNWTIIIFSFIILLESCLVLGQSENSANCIAIYYVNKKSRLTCTVAGYSIKSINIFTVRRGTYIQIANVPFSSSLNSQNYGGLSSNSLNTVFVEFTLPTEINTLYTYYINDDNTWSDTKSFSLNFAPGNVIDNSTDVNQLSSQELIDLYKTAINNYDANSPPSVLTILLQSLDVVVKLTNDETKYDIAFFVLDFINNLIKNNNTPITQYIGYISSTIEYLYTVLKSTSRNSEIDKKVLTTTLYISNVLLNNTLTPIPIVSENILNVTSYHLATNYDNKDNAESALQSSENAGLSGLNLNIGRGYSNYTFSNSLVELSYTKTAMVAETTDIKISDNVNIQKTTLKELDLENDDIILSVIKTKNSVFKANRNSSISNAIEVSLYNRDLKKINVTNVLDPIEISFNINTIDKNTFTEEETVNHTIQTSQYCVWFDGNKWTNEGCYVTFLNTTYVSCSCNHLTLFALQFSDVLIPQILNFAELNSPDSRWSVFAITMAILFGIWIFGALIIYFYERYMYPKNYIIPPNIKSALYEITFVPKYPVVKEDINIHFNGDDHYDIHEFKISITNNTPLTTRSRGFSIGKLISLSILQKSTPGSDFSYSKGLISKSDQFIAIVVTDTKHGIQYVFNPANETTGTDIYSYPQSTTKPCIYPITETIKLSFWKKLQHDMYYQMLDKHLIISIFCRPKLSSYSSLERYLVVYMWITITATCGLAWFNVYYTSIAIRLLQKIIIAIIASFISFIAVTPISYYLRKCAVKPKGPGYNYYYRILIYVIIITITLGCAITSGFYAVTLDKHGLILDWFESFLISIFQTILITQPVLILLISMYKCKFRR